MNSRTGHPGHERSARLNIEARRALGGLLPLADDPGVRDILVAARGGSAVLWVDRGDGAEQVPGWSVPAAEVRRLAVALVSAGGRHVDDLTPCADVRLGDGVRVHVVLAPIAVAGTVVSIRLPVPRAPSLGELARGGLCSTEMATRLANAVAQRENVLITGGAGSGKTTLLNALLAGVQARERIVSIEDVVELRPAHPHHIALETRQANIEGAGEISLDRLLREALRMRPDRIVLGECRGAEIVTLLSALNTGHDGGAGTLHANRIEDVPARLEALGMLAGLPPHALARQAMVLDLIIHVTRAGAQHRIAQLGTPTLTATGTLEVVPLAIGSEG